MNSRDPTYWAFISYSHRDARIASKLLRSLEAYPLPKQLVGTSTRMGPVPPRLKPIFRDRDELEAGARQPTGSVRSTLATSRHSSSQQHRTA